MQPVDPAPRPVEAASDGELARRISARTHAASAEAELCRRFAPRIRLYGLKHLRSEDRARDLVQSVLLVMLEALRAGRVEDSDRIDRFVLGTCRNLALRAHTADARLQPTDTAALELAAVLPDEIALDVSALVRCVDALDDRSRTVVHLSFYREASPDEIARALETTPGNVRVLRHRAVAQLRACLEVGGAT